MNENKSSPPLARAGAEAAASMAPGGGLPFKGAVPSPRAPGLGAGRGGPGAASRPGPSEGDPGTGRPPPAPAPTLPRALPDAPQSLLQATFRVERSCEGSPATAPGDRGRRARLVAPRPAPAPAARPARTHLGRGGGGGPRPRGGRAPHQARRGGRGRMARAAAGQQRCPRPPSGRGAHGPGAPRSRLGAAARLRASTSGLLPAAPRRTVPRERRRARGAARGAARCRRRWRPPRGQKSASRALSLRGARTGPEPASSGPAGSAGARWPLGPGLSSRSLRGR